MMVVDGDDLAPADAPDGEREALGRLVREVWIEWAREQPNPKASWLVPWESLSEPDREVDRRIGEVLYGQGSAARHRPAPADAPDGEREGAYARMSIAEIIHDYAVVRGDLTEQYARDQLAGILAARLDRERRDVGERIAQAIEHGPHRLGHDVSVVCSCVRCEATHAAARIAREEADRD